MCGRFTLAVSPQDVADFFDIREVPDIVPRFNIAPSQPVLIVRATKREEPAGRELEYVTWGLVPGWADDPKIAYKLINARAEGIESKNAFRKAFARRRCLVPASGFYEWRAIPGRKRKQPYYVHPADGGLWAFAGVWERWHSPDGSVIESCSILTTDPNERVAELHDRMPLIVAPRDFDLWLDRDVEDAARLKPLIHPWPADQTALHPVSVKVNRAAEDNDDASMIEEIDPLLADADADAKPEANRRKTKKKTDGDSDDAPSAGRQKELF